VDQSFQEWRICSSGWCWTHLLVWYFVYRFEPKLLKQLATVKKDDFRKYTASVSLTRRYCIFVGKVPTGTVVKHFLTEATSIWNWDMKWLAVFCGTCEAVTWLQICNLWRRIWRVCTSCTLWVATGIHSVLVRKSYQTRISLDGRWLKTSRWLICFWL